MVAIAFYGLMAAFVGALAYFCLALSLHHYRKRAWGGGFGHLVVGIMVFGIAVSLASQAFGG